MSDIFFPQVTMCDEDVCNPLRPDSKEFLEDDADSMFEDMNGNEDEPYGPTELPVTPRPTSPTPSVPDGTVERGGLSPLYFCLPWASLADENRILKIKYCSYKMQNTTIPGPGKYLTTYANGEQYFHYKNQFNIEDDETGVSFLKFLTNCQQNAGRSFKLEGARKRKTCTPPVTNLMLWPFPIWQEKGHNCASNALKNIGMDLRDLQFDGCSSLSHIILQLGNRKKFRWSIKKVDEFQQAGTYVFSCEGHCFSVIDGWVLDTDPRFPSPLKDLQILGVSRFDSVYQFCKR